MARSGGRGSPIVTEVAGKVRGFLCLRRGLAYELDGPYVQLLAIVVDSEWQGTGVGTTLARAAEEWARTQDATRIILTSGMQRKTAHRFYERLGYQATGLRFVKTL